MWRASCLQPSHADLCGPMSTESIGGNKYFVLFIDDFNRIFWVYFVKYKADTLNCFRRFHALVECETRKKLKALQSDHGCEFLSNDFRDYWSNLGIRRELTAPYTP